MTWTIAINNFGGSTSINSLIEFNSKLYGMNQAGQLLEFDDVIDWALAATNGLGSNAKNTIVHTDNKLYALSTFGQMFVWNEISLFNSVTTNSLGSGGGLGGFLSFNGKIYTGIDILYESILLAEFVNVASSPGIANETFQNFIEFNSQLYGGLTNGSLYEWNGINAWVLVADGTALSTSFQTLKSIFIFQNKIFAVFNERTLLAEWDGVSAWIETNPASGGGASASLSSSLVFNDFIYAANSLSELFKSTGGNYTFVHAGDPVDVNTMISFNNKLHGAGI